MTDAEVLSRIASVVLAYNDATGTSIRAVDLAPGDHFCDDLGGKSMDLIGMILGFEDEFGISIGQDDLLDVDPWRLGNLVSYIQMQMAVTN